MIGKHISHYEIEALLGEGAMGRVFRARDVVLDRHVALKLLATNIAADPTFLERFLREARLAAQLSHAHIATIHEFGQADGQTFLVMELVDGETLEARIARGPLPLQDVRRFGAQAASALSAAHARGIVHRDIKPANLMITRAGVLKVMDFGIARRAGDTAITAAGSLIGTPKTIAPEILRGKEPEPPADLFALGCVLYEAITGRAAFSGDDIMAVLYQVAQQDPTPMRQLRGGIPDDLVAVVEGLLVKDPAQRFGPADAVVQALWSEGTISATGRVAADATLDIGAVAARTQATMPPAAISSAAVPAPARPSGRRRLLLVAMIALAAATTGVVLQRRASTQRQMRARELNDRGAVQAERLDRIGMAGALVESLAAARVSFEAAVKLDPEYAVPWNNLGHLSQFAGELPRAEREYAKAVQLDPRFATARLNWAAVLEELGNQQQAVSEYRNAMRDDSTLVAAPNNLAHLLNELGRSDEAVLVLRPALQRWPDVPALWKNYGMALSHQGQMDAAEAALQKSLELAPSQPAVVDELARIKQVRSSRATGLGSSP